MIAQTGLILDERTLRQTVNATGRKLIWTKIKGTPFIHFEQLS